MNKRYYGCCIKNVFLWHHSYSSLAEASLLLLPLFQLSGSLPHPLLCLNSFSCSQRARSFSVAKTREGWNRAGCLRGGVTAAPPTLSSLQLVAAPSSPLLWCMALGTEETAQAGTRESLGTKRAVCTSSCHCYPFHKLPLVRASGK